MAASREAAKQRRAAKKVSLSLDMAANIAAKRQAARFRKASKAAELIPPQTVDLRCLTACPSKSPPSTTPKTDRRWGSAKPDAAAAWPDDQSLSRSETTDTASPGCGLSIRPTQTPGVRGP